MKGRNIIKGMNEYERIEIIREEIMGDTNRFIQDKGIIVMSERLKEKERKKDLLIDGKKKKRIIDRSMRLCRGVWPK